LVNYLQTEDIIVAQCTSDGPGAINIIRLSGSNLNSIYKIITKSKSNPKANTIIYKGVYVKNVFIDHALVSFFRGPRSFTGEDIIEINCHGGRVISKKIIKKIVSAKHARHALPGEFSFRAYYNGKIDVLQAESIDELIKSQTNIFANKTMENINGRVSSKIKKIKKSLITLSSIAEYDLDIDESDLSVTQSGEIKERLNKILIDVKDLSGCSLYSNIIKNGLRVVLIGKPNVGKSTMFNYLLGFNRSIVSSVAGTTRDTVEAVLEIDGHKIIFVDTAGCWRSNEEIEKIGIKKTKEEINSADIVLFLGEKDSDLELIGELGFDKDCIKVLSKSDINSSKQYDVQTSSVDGVGFNSLLTVLSTKITKIIYNKDLGSEYYINERQQLVLKEILTKGRSLLQEISLSVEKDVLATLIKDLLDTLNEIVDPINKEDIINNIFSNFCVGK